MNALTERINSDDALGVGRMVRRRRHVAAPSRHFAGTELAAASGTYSALGCVAS